MFKAKVDDLIMQVLASKFSASLKWEALVVGMKDVIRDCGKYFSNVLKGAKVEAEHVISLTEKVDMGFLLDQREYLRLCDAYRCLHFAENNAIHFAKVRARCMEVNDLQASSKCFFDFLRAKRAANTISLLEACSNHFKNLLAASYSTDDSWFAALHDALMHTPQCLDSRMAAACETSITEEEIFFALGSLKNGKAPGLDEINGRLSTPFPVQRSVRQGCPLSPLFYAMASTPMFYLLQAKMESGFIHGISLHGSQHIVVGFADDTFLFAKAYEENIQRIFISLTPFSKASSLNISMGKSALIKISAQHFLFPSWQGRKIECGFIFRHLGYPLGINVPIKDQIQWVLCKIKNKMNLWHAAQWPLHIRIRIVQSILQPYIMYYILLLDWKKCHLYSFDCLIKNFLWNKSHNRALVFSSWEFVCQPKSTGGLGILNLHAHMMARRTALLCLIHPWLMLWVQQHVISIIKGSTQFQLPLSIDASQPWRDWLFAKHTRWWNATARTFYLSLFDDKDITFQCNLRWKSDKTRAWWQTRFSTIWDSYLTFKMKVFMWRILVGHFTLGAFLSKHGIQGVPCPHCASYAETMRHAFWSCSYIQRWWNTLFLFPIWDNRPSKFCSTFLLFEFSNEAWDWVRKRCIFFLLWNIWQLRNKTLFGNKRSVPHFSWTLCKAKLRLDMEVMSAEHRSAVVSFLDRI
ncbi:hypothetical protein KP509_07G083200 [Ceratopteris richardii]|uniref:Reverse transcriptase domain-containing protein n=1 Tax=Ceratopteris richardii TaxID=49495 RepID=A0A8T2UIS9_CERRI|nr:hypothetical protein KP509_07G083200 [Ceratopteris richardii]